MLWNRSKHHLPQEALHLLVDSTGLRIYGEVDTLDQTNGLIEGIEDLCSRSGQTR
jgi:hypothetical protein